MNNKKIGNEFEIEFCQLMAADGYWVHFISPDNRGAQPFDVIAAKDGKPIAVDCKTCVAKSFSINRLEQNQISAFELWLKCGNGDPWVAVKHKGEVYLFRYVDLRTYGALDIVKEGIKYDKDKGFGGVFG